MKIIIIILILFIPFILFAQNKDIVDYNGEGWLSFSDSHKTGYITGYLSSVSQQYDLIYTFSSLPHNKLNLSYSDSLGLSLAIHVLESKCKRRIIYT